MAGYNWMHGKSNNAVAAEEKGMRVASKITRAWLDDAGITESAAFIKWLIRVDYIAADEWHHSSKYFNRVNYYAAESIAEQLDWLAEHGNLSHLRDMYKEPEWRRVSCVEAHFEVWERARVKSEENKE